MWLPAGMPVLLGIIMAANMVAFSDDILAHRAAPAYCCFVDSHVKREYRQSAGLYQHCPICWLQMGQVHHPMGTPEMASRAAESSSSRQGCVTSLCSLGTARMETGVITHMVPKICGRRAVLR